MTATSYTQATTAQTEAEILADSFALALTNGVNVAGFDDVAPQVAIFRTDARALGAEQAIRVQLANAAFLTRAALAGDTWFDEALTWYDLDNGFGGKGRIPATTAIWVFKVSLSAGATALTIAANSKELTAQADDGTFFVSSNVVPVPIPSGGYGLVQFNCTTPGSVGNQASGNVTHLVVGYPGLSVTNASPGFQAYVARDQETTAEATARALAKWSTLGAGWTRASFDYLIPTLSTSVTRWIVRDDNPNGPGTIEVDMANAAGPSTSLENAAVLAGLGAPAVMTLGTGGLSVVSAGASVVVVTGTIHSDGTNPNLLINAKAALDLLASKFPIGGDSTGGISVTLIISILQGGAFPASSPLKITGPSGNVATIVIPGFAGVTSVTLTAPTPPGPVFSLLSVFSFDYSGLVVA